MLHNNIPEPSIPDYYLTVNGYQPGYQPIFNFKIPKIMELSIADVFQTTQAPPLMIFNIALSTAALALQGRITVQGIINTETPIGLYILTIAESGERKTTVENIYTKFIKEFEDIKNQRFEKDKQNYKNEKYQWDLLRKGKEKALKKIISQMESESDPKYITLRKEMDSILLKEPKEPTPIKITYSDTTIEGLQEGLIGDQKSAGLIISEGGGFLSRSGNIKWLSTLNQLWDSEVITIDRKTSGKAIIQNPKLTMSIMAQPDVFRKFFNKENNVATNIGFTSRTLVSYPISTQGYRNASNSPINQQHLKKYISFLRSHLEISYTPYTRKLCLIFDQNAKEELIKFANKIESGTNQVLPNHKGFTSKIANQTTRIAAIFHLLNGGEQSAINLISVQMAIGIANMYIEEYFKIFSQNGLLDDDYNKAQMLKMWLLEKRYQCGVPIRKNDIRNIVPKELRNASSLNNALLNLQNQGFLYLTTFVEHNKKPIECFLINQYS